MDMNVISVSLEQIIKLSLFAFIIFASGIKLINLK